jgi:hypothetical protein
VPRTIVDSLVERETLTAFQPAPRGDVTNPGLVAYTAIFGGRDTLADPGLVTPGCRYVCFTDASVRSDVWEIVLQPPGHPDPRQQARRHKVLAHRFFETQYSLWVDGSIRINVDIRALIDRYLDGADLALFAHPDRDCLYDEAEVCLELGLDRPDRIRSQIERYRRAGLPQHIGLAATIVLLRRHTATMVQLNEAWWREIEAGSVRDQLSFNYCAWRLGFAYRTFPGNFRTGSALELLGHRR